MVKMVTNLPVMWETQVWFLGWEDSLHKGMATHSSILTWRIPWTEELCGLQYMGSQKRVGHDWVTNIVTKNIKNPHIWRCSLESFILLFVFIFDLVGAFRALRSPIAPMPSPHQSQERWDPWRPGLSPIPPGAGASVFLLLQVQFPKLTSRRDSRKPLSWDARRAASNSGFIIPFSQRET